MRSSAPAPQRPPHGLDVSSSRYGARSPEELDPRSRSGRASANPITSAKANCELPYVKSSLSQPQSQPQPQPDSASLSLSYDHTRENSGPAELLSLGPHFVRTPSVFPILLITELLSLGPQSVSVSASLSLSQAHT